MPAGQNIQSTLLSRGDELSYHYVQIRDSETPHVHVEHDLVVTTLAGHGTLHIGGSVLPMRPGDSAFIPRNTPHFFVNEGTAPTAALVVFAPPYDGRDNVPIQ